MPGSAYDGDVPALDDLLDSPALAETFVDGKHPRSALGRWIATFNHSVHGTITTPIEASSSTDAWSQAEVHARALSGGRVNATVQSVVPVEKLPDYYTAAGRVSGIHPDAPPPAIHGQAAMDRAKIAQEKAARAAKMPVTDLLSHDPTGPVRPEHVDPSRHPVSVPGAGGTFTAERHGGFKVGDQVTYSTSRRDQGRGEPVLTRQPGVHEVAGLMRNGNLRLRDPGFGTTVDAHHSLVKRADAAALREAALERKLTAELEQLGQGRYHSLPAIAGGHAIARRVGNRSWEVYHSLRATPEATHPSPVTTARHMIRIRQAGVPVRESRPDVLGVLLEAN